MEQNEFFQQLQLKEIFYNCTECSSPIEILSINEIDIEFKCIKNNHNKKISIKEYIEKMKHFNDENELGQKTVRILPCPQTPREKNEGRYLEMKNKVQGSYLVIFRGEFAGRGVYGQFFVLSRKKLEDFIEDMTLGLKVYTSDNYENI